MRHNLCDKPPPDRLFGADELSRHQDLFCSKAADFPRKSDDEFDMKKEMHVITDAKGQGADVETDAGHLGEPFSKGNILGDGNIESEQENHQEGVHQVEPQAQVRIFYLFREKA